MKIVTDRKRIEEIFNRGVVVEILPSRETLLKEMMSGRRLRIYIGADPTSDALHLSHAKNYMFLEELRRLGHEVIVLFGDFTAQIGDPTNRSETRPHLTEKQVKENMRSWLSQIKPLMNFNDKSNPPRILYNGKWLSKLSLKEIIALASNFTVQQIIERDMFEKRWEGKIPIHLHEFLYPLMQGYDSVAMDVDVELCGTDQIFNALAGRTLLKRLKNKEKFVIAVNLMANPKTGALMSKSSGTGVFLSSPPNEMFGAIMAQPDEMTEVLFVNCTRIPLEKNGEIMSLGPRDAKLRIAFEIVKIFYGEKMAEKARENWIKTFSKKETPTEVEELRIKNKELNLTGLLLKTGVPSKSEARRLIEQNAVKINNEIKKDPQEKITFKGGEVLKIGKHKFFKIE